MRGWARAAVVAAAVAGAAVAGVFALPAGAEAAFSGTASGATTVSSAGLRTVTDLQSTSHQCGLAVFPGSAALTWTASSDSYVTGYEVSVSRSGGASVVTAVSGRSTTSATVSLGAGMFTSYSITITSVYRGWRSTPSQPVSFYCIL